MGRSWLSSGKLAPSCPQHRSHHRRSVAVPFGGSRDCRRLGSDSSRSGCLLALAKDRGTVNGTQAGQRRGVVIEGGAAPGSEPTADAILAPAAAAAAAADQAVEAASASPAAIPEILPT